MSGTGDFSGKKKLPELSLRLKSARRASKVTQEAAAQALGVRRQTYGAYERGISTPDANSIAALASLFGVSADVLCGLEQPAAAVASGLEQTTEAPLTDKAGPPRPANDALYPDGVLFTSRGTPYTVDREGRRIFYTSGGRPYLRVPVYGKVAAGLPIEAIEDVTGYEEVDASLAAGGALIALTVRGDSMEPMLCSGDVVIVRRQPDVENGDIAVVLVNGDDAVVKKIQKHRTGVVLVSLNTAYEPMYYTNEEIESLPLTVVGRVVELRRKL